MATATPFQSYATEVANLALLNQDLLSMILYHCLPRDEAVETPPKPGSQHLVLGQICRTLRWSLHANSIFWTRFYITSTTGKQHRGIFMEWLHRAKECGSSLPISIENKSESGFSSLQLEELVLPLANRLWRLHVHLTYDAMETLFTSFPPCTFPQLSDFWMSCTDFSGPSILTVGPAFLSSPLEQFAITLGPPVNVRGLGITWANLKTLRLDAMSEARFYFPISWVHTILDACHDSLETCSIAVEPTTDAELGHVELPHLKALSINFRDSGAKTQSSIFNILITPSLSFLELSSRDGLVFNETCNALKSFFHRSSNIERLHFERTPTYNNVTAGARVTVDSQKLIGLITLLPNLRRVRLPKGHHTLIMLVLESILLRSVCPHLEWMELAVHNGLDVVRAIQFLWRQREVGGGKKNLKMIKIIDPKLSWIGICEPSAAEDPEITQGRKVIDDLEGEGLKIET